MELPKWDWRQVMPRFRELMELDVDRVIFMYVTGARPENDVVQEMLREYGTVEDEVTFMHKSRIDTITVIKKG